MPTSSISRRLVCAVALLVAPVPFAACADVTAPEPVPGEILFLSNQLKDSLYYLRPFHALHAIGMDGAGLRSVIPRPDLNFSYDVSRDGRRIVVNGPEADIWSANVAGTEIVRLTNRGATRTDGSNHGARWSHDGRLIAFVSNRERRQYGSTVGVSDVYVMNADGSSPRNVSSGLGDEIGFEPMVLGWTPAGEIIIRTHEVVGGVSRTRVYFMRPDGTPGRAPLPEQDGPPVFSPSGSHVVFTRTESGIARLYVMNADGSNARPLTNQAGDVLEPGDGLRSPWSPDGRTIVFRRAGADAPGLYVVTVDGTGLRRIVAGYDARFGSWSPAGDRIALSMDHDIHIAAVNGSGPQNVTRSPGVVDIAPVWLPR
ncbi:MAG: PD40 domain-containing protein [Gemmatimonadaceae bacterium]|nr:PD40 domain-containing protein [Gemmatimonadaceae bacterium]